MAFKLDGFDYLSNGAVAPQNEGQSPIAQEVLDNTAARANRQLQNALAVDGNALYVWRRQGGGVACPCARQTAASLKAQYQNPMTTGQGLGLGASPVKPGIGGVYAVPQASGPGGYGLGLGVSAGGWGSTSTATGAAYTGAGADTNQDARVRALSTDPWESPNGLDGALPFGYDAEEAALLDLSDQAHSRESIPCGICFGTGFTQGYDLFAGSRINLCAATAPPFSLVGGAQLDTESLPVGFKLGYSLNSAVVWRVELPAYAKGVAVAPFKNSRLASNIAVEYSPDGGTLWLPLTTEALSKTGPKNWLVRARVSALGRQREETPFTHITISLLTGALPKAQAPNIEEAVAYEFLQSPVEAQWVFPPTLPALERETVFYDQKYGYLWRVNRVQQQKTSNGQIFGYQVGARVIQTNEKFAPLFYAMQRVTDNAYRGLEDWQGAERTQENAHLQHMVNRMPSFPDSLVMDCGPQVISAGAGSAAETGGGSNGENDKNKLHPAPVGVYGNAPGVPLADTPSGPIQVSASSMLPSFVLTMPFPSLTPYREIVTGSDQYRNPDQLHFDVDAGVRFGFGKETQTQPEIEAAGTAASASTPSTQTKEAPPAENPWAHPAGPRAMPEAEPLALLDDEGSGGGEAPELSLSPSPEELALLERAGASFGETAPEEGLGPAPEMAPPTTAKPVEAQALGGEDETGWF